MFLDRHTNPSQYPTQRRLTDVPRRYKLSKFLASVYGVYRHSGSVPLPLEGGKRT